MERWRMFALPARKGTPTDEVTRSSRQPFGGWTLAWVVLIVHKVLNTCATVGVFFLRFSNIYQ